MRTTLKEQIEILEQEGTSDMKNSMDGLQFRRLQKKSSTNLKTDQQKLLNLKNTGAPTKSVNKISETLVTFGKASVIQWARKWSPGRIGNKMRQRYI